MFRSQASFRSAPNFASTLPSKMSHQTVAAAKPVSNMLRNVTQRAMQQTLTTLQTPRSQQRSLPPNPLFPCTTSTTQLAQLYTRSFRALSTLHKQTPMYKSIPQLNLRNAVQQRFVPPYPSTRRLHTTTTTISTSTAKFQPCSHLSHRHSTISRAFQPSHPRRGVIFPEMTEEEQRAYQKQRADELRKLKILPPVPERPKDPLHLTKEEMQFYGLTKDTIVKYDPSKVQDDFSRLKKRKLIQLHILLATASLLYGWFLYDQREMIRLEKELGLYDPTEERENFWRWAYLKMFDHNTNAAPSQIQSISGVPASTINQPGQGFLQPQYSYAGAETIQDSQDYDPYGYLASPKYRLRQEYERANKSSDISRYVDNVQRSDLRKQTFLGDLTTAVRGFVRPEQTPEVLDGMSKRWEKNAKNPAFQHQYQADLDSMKMYTDRRVPKYMDFADDPDKRDFYYERVPNDELDDGDYDYYSDTDDVIENDMSELEGGMFRYRDDEVFNQRLAAGEHLSPYEDGGFTKDIENANDSLFMEPQKRPYPAHYRMRDQAKREDLSHMQHALLQMTPEERVQLIEGVLGIKINDKDGVKSNARKIVQTAIERSDDVNVPPSVMEELLNRTSYKNLFRHDDFDPNDPTAQARERTHREDYPGRLDEDYYDPSRETIFKMTGGVPVPSTAYPPIYNTFNEFKFDNTPTIDYVDGVPFFDMRQFRLANAFTQSSTLLQLIRSGLVPEIDTFEPNSKTSLPPVILQEVSRDNATQGLSAHQKDIHIQTHRSIRTLNTSLALVGSGARTTWSQISDSFIARASTWLPQALKSVLHYLPTQTHYCIGVYIDSSLFLQHFTRVLPFSQSIKNENKYRSALRLDKIPVWDHAREEYLKLMAIPVRNQNSSIIQRIQHLFARLRYRTFGPKTLIEPSIPHFQKVFPQAEAKSIALALTSKLPGKWLSDEFFKLIQPNICDGRPVESLGEEPNYNDFGVPIPITPATLGLHTYRMKYAILREYRQAKEYATLLGMDQDRFEQQFPMNELSLRKQMLFSNKSIRYQFDQYQALRDRGKTELKAALHQSIAQMNSGLGPNDIAVPQSHQDIPPLPPDPIFDPFRLSEESDLEHFLEQEKLDLGPQPISLSTTIALKTFMNILETTEEFSKNQSLSFSWGVNNESVMIKMPIPVLHAMMEFSNDPRFLLSYELYKSIEHNVKNGFTPTGIDFELLLQHFGTTNAEVNKALRDEHERLVELQKEQLTLIQKAKEERSRVVTQGIHHHNELSDPLFQLSNLNSPQSRDAFDIDAQQREIDEEALIQDPMAMKSQGQMHAQHFIKNAPPGALHLPSTTTSTSSPTNNPASFADDDDMSQYTGAAFQIRDASGQLVKTAPLSTSFREISDQSKLRDMLELPRSMETSASRAARSAILEHYDMVHNAEFRRELLLKEFPPDKPFPGLAYYRKKYATEQQKTEDGGKDGEVKHVGEKNPDFLPSGLANLKNHTRGKQNPEDDIFGALYVGKDGNEPKETFGKKSRYDKYITSASAHLAPLGDSYFKEHPEEYRKRARLMGKPVSPEDNLTARIRFRDFFTEEHPEALVALTNPIAADSLSITDPKLILMLQEYATDKRIREMNKAMHFPLLGTDTHRNLILARREEELRTKMSGPTLRFVGEGEDEVVIIENSGLTEVNFDLTSGEFLLFLARDQARRHQALLDALDDLHEEFDAIPDQHSRELARYEAQLQRQKMLEQAQEIDAKMKDLRAKKVENYKKQLRIERGLAPDDTSFDDQLEKELNIDPVIFNQPDLRNAMADFNPNFLYEQMHTKIALAEIGADKSADQLDEDGNPITSNKPSDLTTTSEGESSGTDDEPPDERYYTDIDWSQVSELKKSKDLAKISQALAILPSPTDSSIIHAINSHRNKLKDRYRKLQQLSQEVTKFNPEQPEQTKARTDAGKTRESFETSSSDEPFDDSYAERRFNRKNVPLKDPYDPRLVKTIPNTKIPVPKLASATSLPLDTEYVKYLSKEMLKFDPMKYQYDPADDPTTREMKRQKLNDYYEWLRMTREDSHSTNISDDVKRHENTPALMKLNELLGNVGEASADKPNPIHTTLNLGIGSQYRKKNPDERNDPRFIRQLLEKDTNQLKPSSLTFQRDMLKSETKSKQPGVIGEAERFMKRFSTLDANTTAEEFGAELHLAMMSKKELRENHYLLEKYAHLNPKNKDAVKAHRLRQEQNRKFAKMSPRERIRSKDGLRFSIEQQEFRKGLKKRVEDQGRYVPKRHSAWKDPKQKHPRWIDSDTTDNDDDELFRVNKGEFYGTVSDDDFDDQFPFLSAEQRVHRTHRRAPPNQGNLDPEAHAWDDEASKDTKLSNRQSHELFELKHPDVIEFGFNPYAIEEDFLHKQLIEEEVKKSQQKQQTVVKSTNPLSAFGQLERLRNDPTVNTTQPETVEDMIAMYYRHALEMLTRDYQNQVLQRLEYLQDIVATVENEFPTGWFPDHNELHIATFNPTAVVAHIEAALNINPYLDLNVELPLSNTLLTIERVGLDGTLELSSNQQLTLQDHDSWLTNQLPHRYHEQFKHLAHLTVQEGAPTAAELDQFRIYDTRRALVLNDQAAVDKLFGVTDLKDEIKRVLAKYQTNPDLVQQRHQIDNMFSGVKQYIDSNLPNEYEKLGIHSGNMMEDVERRDHEKILNDPSRSHRSMKKMEQIDNFVRKSSNHNATQHDVAEYERGFDQFIGEEMATDRKLSKKEQMEQQMQKFEDRMMRSRVNKLARLQTQNEAILIIKDPLFSSAIMRAFLGTAGNSEDQLESFLREQLMRYNVIHNPLNNATLYEAEDALKQPVDLHNPISGKKSQFSAAARHLRTGHPLDRTLIHRLNKNWLDWDVPDPLLPPHQRSNRSLPVDMSLTNLPSTLRQRVEFNPEDPYYHPYESPATPNDPLTLDVTHNLKISDFEIVDTTWDDRILSRINLVEAIPPFFLPLLTRFNDQLNPAKTSGKITAFLPPNILDLLSQDTSIFQPFLDKVNRFKRVKAQQMKRTIEKVKRGELSGLDPDYIAALTSIDHPWNIDMDDLFEQFQFEQDQGYIEDDVQYDIGNMLASTQIYDHLQHNIRQVLIGQKKYREAQLQEEKERKAEQERLVTDLYTSLPSNRLRDNEYGSTIDIQRRASQLYFEGYDEDIKFRDKSFKLLHGIIDQDELSEDEEDELLFSDRELESLIMTSPDPALREAAKKKLQDRKTRARVRKHDVNVRQNIYHMTEKERWEHARKYDLPPHQEQWNYAKSRVQNEKTMKAELPDEFKPVDAVRRAYDNDAYLASFMSEPLHVGPPQNTTNSDNEDDDDDDDSDDAEEYVYGLNEAERRSKRAKRERLRRQKEEMYGKSRSVIDERNELTSSINQFTDLWTKVSEDTFEQGRQMWKERKHEDLMSDLRLKKLRDVEALRERQDYHYRKTGDDDYDVGFDQYLYTQEQLEKQAKGQQRGYYDTKSSLLLQPVKKVVATSRHMLNKTVNYLSQSIDRQIKRKVREYREDSLSEQLYQERNPNQLPGHQFLLNELGRSNDLDARRFLTALNSGVLTEEQARVIRELGLPGAINYYKNGGELPKPPPSKAQQRQALEADLEEEWDYARNIQKIRLLDEPFRPERYNDDDDDSSDSLYSQRESYAPGRKPHGSAGYSDLMNKKQQNAALGDGSLYRSQVMNPYGASAHDSLDQRFNHDYDDQDEGTLDLDGFDEEQQEMISGLIGQLLRENNIDVAAMPPKQQQQVLTSALNQVLHIIQEQMHNDDDDYQ